MLKKVIELFKNPKKIKLYIIRKIGKKINDKKYLQLLYKIRFDKKIDFDNPKTFNEKLNWLKLYDRNDKYTMLADKYLVKEYVEKTIGKEYVIKNYKIWENVEDINLDELPCKFVMKCNHDSGGLIICKNKENINLEDVKDKLKRSLENNYFYYKREWPYKNIKPLILVEEFIEDKEMEDLRDYKFMCFNGVPKFVYITVKNDNIWENYYDMEFNPVEINHGFPRYKEEFKKPENFDEMVKIAKQLSKDIPFVRIDLHNTDGKIYFGEFTFYDWGGLRPYSDEKYDKLLGDLLKIEGRK